MVKMSLQVSPKLTKNPSIPEFPNIARFSIQMDSKATSYCVLFSKAVDPIKKDPCKMHGPLINLNYVCLDWTAASPDRHKPGIN